MDVNLRQDDRFVQDEAWYAAEARYGEFLEGAVDKRLVMLELGVGFNTPGVIRWPFERILHADPQATLIRINPTDLQGPPENEARTISFGEDTAATIRALLAAGG